MTFESGWYHVGETWDLFIDGELREVPVDYVEVSKDSKFGFQYNVTHYDRAGDLLVTLTLTEGDLSDTLGDVEPDDRPSHI